jgi:hypothetical protein
VHARGSRHTGGLSPIGHLRDANLSNFVSGRLREIVSIGIGKPVPKRNTRLPPQSAKLVYTHQFAGRTVGLRKIVRKGAVETHDFPNQFRKIQNA